MFGIRCLGRFGFSLVRLVRSRRFRRGLGRWEEIEVVSERRRVFGVFKGGR